MNFTEDDAEMELKKHGIVPDYHNDFSVKDEDLLKACGYDNSDIRGWVRDISTSHNFKEHSDLIHVKDHMKLGKGRKPLVTYFTIEASKHVVLSALTSKGKEVRTKAINQDKQMALVQADLAAARLQTIDVQSQLIEAQKYTIEGQSTVIGSLTTVTKELAVKTHPITDLVHSKYKSAIQPYLDDKGLIEPFLNKDGVQKGWKLTDKGIDAKIGSHTNGDKANSQNIRYRKEVLNHVPTDWAK